MKTGKLHAAALKDSARLQRVLAFLRERGSAGATTFEIITGARVAAVNSVAAELRANGIGVQCVHEATHEDKTRVYRYTLTEALA